MFRDDDASARLGGGGCGGRAASGGRQPRPLARHSLRAQGFVRRQGHRHRVGRGAVPRSRARHRCLGCAQAAHRRCGAARKDGGRRVGLQRNLVRRPRAQSLEPERGIQWIECGLSLGHGGGAMCFFDRDGDARVDYFAVPALRDDRPAPDLRAGLSRGRDGVVLVARQGGADLPIGRGYRDGARRHQRVGHRRSLFDRGAFPFRRQRRHRGDAAGISTRSFRRGCERSRPSRARFRPTARARGDRRFRCRSCPMAR